MTVDAITASAGMCVPFAGDLLSPRPVFRPLRGWRAWFTRGDAGGPLLGHVTLPRYEFRLRDHMPTFTATRGPITFVTVPKP